jgi:hypothetical protein
MIHVYFNHEYVGMSSTHPYPSTQRIEVIIY